MLRIRIDANRESLVDVEVRNVGAHDDDYHRYEVRDITDAQTGPVTLTLLHRRSRGATNLAMKVLLALRSRGLAP